MLTATLIGVAFVAGVAGSWSPCGLSMVDTLAPDACGGRRRVSVVGALAFAVGALAGGVVTFGGLALLGDRLGAGGGLAAAVAIFALLVAAVGDAAGRRIVPQVRRQVPESWRRVLPVPLACGLYGVLLGLGFTTFVLSFATWGLAAMCLAVGAPATGVAVGVAFGLGRAVPVGVLAPLQDRDAFAAVTDAMGERPIILRSLRVGAALGLVAAAISLAASPPAARAEPAGGATTGGGATAGGGAATAAGDALARASAATIFADPARDPSAANGIVAWQAGDAGVLQADGQSQVLPGVHPAVGGPYVAWVQDDTAVVADVATLQPVFSFAAPGADALAVSGTHLAWRAPGSNGRDTIFARELAAPAETPPATVATAARRETLGRPVLNGTTVVYDHQSPRVSRIRGEELADGDAFTLRSAREALLLAPSMVGDELLFVRSTATRQRVMLGNRTVYATTPTARRDKGHEPGLRDHRQGYPRGKRPKKAPRPPAGLTVTLWTTALDGDTAYVTRLRHRTGGRTSARVLAIGL